MDQVKYSHMYTTCFKWASFSPLMFCVCSLTFFVKTVQKAKEERSSSDSGSLLGIFLSRCSLLCAEMMLLLLLLCRNLVSGTGCFRVFQIFGEETDPPRSVLLTLGGCASYSPRVFFLLSPCRTSATTPTSSWMESALTTCTKARWGTAGLWRLAPPWHREKPCGKR